MLGKNKFYDGSGLFQCQFCVGELIRCILLEVLQCGDIYDLDFNCMLIMVGEVCMSLDLKIVMVYVLFLGGKGQENVLKLLVVNKVELC